MTKLLAILVVLGCYCGILSADSSSQIDNDLYQIEHAIGDSQEFTPIGQVNLRHLKQTQNAAHYQMLDSADESKQSNIPQQIPVELLSTELETFRLEPVHIDQIESSLRANEHSIYQLRLCKKTLPSQPQKCLASTFTHLKSLIDANMVLQLTINLGLNNNLNSISIKPWSGKQRIGGAGDSTRRHKNDRVTVYASVQSIRQAAGPDTESYLEKLRIEREQKEKSAQSGNESFLSKYWIYIVPFVVIMFLMNIVNPEGGAPGGGAAR